MRLDVDGGTVLESIGDEIVNGPILFMAYQGTAISSLSGPLPRFTARP